MKITHVEAIILESPRGYGVHGGEASGPKYRSLLRVSTDAGIDGWAEIETQPHALKAVIEAPGDGTGFFDGIGSLAVGEDPFDVERLWTRLFNHTMYYGRRGVVLQAISGIDIACYDIMGKALNKPVHALLGGARRQQVPAYASTLFRDTPQAMKEAAQRYVDAGYTAVKFGWGGFGRNRHRDAALVQAARESLGKDRVLMVDAGWIYPRSVEETIALIQAIEPFDPFWVEEPCHPEDYAAYKAVADATSVRIAAGEQEGTVWGFEHLIREGGVDVVQPDLSRCGGFTVARQVVWLAEGAGRSLCPHAWQSDLLTAASLHLNAIVPAGAGFKGTPNATHRVGGPQPNPGPTVFQEYNVCDDPISRSLCRTPLRCVDGLLAVPDGPGLGVEIDEETVARFRVDG